MTETGIEDYDNYLPKTRYGRFWFMEGACLGATAVLLLVLAFLLLGNP